ncbi:MAG: TRAP transporter substrate-binding protein [Deltaproteobacteria bacterium]|nr:TRAP transporter substrate-binding protein [Deltaproteobacteria bacterium]
MKRKLFLVLMIIAVAVAFTTLSFQKAQAAPIKLTYSCFFPPTHIQSKLAEAWSKEVAKRTNGRVKVEYYPGGTLTKAKQCYDGAVTGISDLGFSVLAYTGSRFPVMSAIDLPFGYPNGKVATAVINEVYKKFMPKELLDSKVMYLHAHGPGLIHTRDKMVTKLEDLKGLKLRGHGTSAKFQKALGATPVGAPMPECYQMIQKGVVKGASYPFEANKGWRLGEVSDYAVAAFSAAYTTSFFVVMNKDKWNSLPADIQKIIEEINGEWVIKHGEAWDASDMEGIYYFLNHGGVIIGLDKKEAARWKKAVRPVIDDYIQAMNKKGFNGKEIVDFTMKTLAKYSK